MKKFLVRIIVVLLSLVILTGLSACRSQDLQTALPISETSEQMSPGIDGHDFSAESPDRTQLPLEPELELESESKMECEMQSKSELGVEREPESKLVEVRSIIVELDSKVVTKGANIEPVVIILPEDAADKSYVLSSRDTSVAKILDDGTVTAVGAGTTQIVVKSGNGVYGTRTISVIDLAFFADEVLRLTNLERERANLHRFGANPQLTRVAEVRAIEIIEYFSHTRPDGRDCFTAFTENHVAFYTAGENLAVGQTTPDEVIRGWMNSPGHRENILNEAFGQLGVAVIMDGNGRLHWTQTFTD